MNSNLPNYPTQMQSSIIDPNSGLPFDKNLFDNDMEIDFEQREQMGEWAEDLHFINQETSHLNNPLVPSQS